MVKAQAMTKAQIDKRILAIFNALLWEWKMDKDSPVSKDRIVWCEKKAQQARVRLMQEAREEAKKRNAR